MSNKNKLIGLSLIALATLCACNDDNYADGKGNRLVTFSVNAKANGGWSDINGSRSAWMSPQAQQMGEPVEMEGKLNGNSVYLTSEVTEGFPTDNPTFTRGTQITNADGMSSFGVTAFMGSQKYMDHVEIKKSADSWKPETDYFWLNGKSLDFYAWYPYNSAEGTNGIPSGMTLNNEDFSSISYTVPTDVSKQEDLMFAVNKNASEPKDGKATSLDFKHSLAAVKFVISADLLPCSVKSISLKGVKYKGVSSNINTGNDKIEWVENDDVSDFTCKINKELDGTANPAVAEIEQTFFMMPQNLPDNAMIEVVLNNGNKDHVLKPNLKKDANTNMWEAGKTYTYRISHDFVSLMTSNSEFIACTDQALTNQVAFFVTAASTHSASDAGTITSDNNAVVVSPASFTNNAAKLPISVTWPANVNEATLNISFAGKTQQVKIKRNQLNEGIFDAGYWLYSDPEVTSKSIGADITSIQNASKSTWLAFTNSSDYDKNAKFTEDPYTKADHGENVYLQTLSFAPANRFASLLAEKTDPTQNVMVCVEQKGLIAKFGFKDCDNNISRESEKWNIVIQKGGRFKGSSGTEVQAQVVISSNHNDDKIDEQHPRILGDPVCIKLNGASDCVSESSYIKKCWDSQKEDAINNGERDVNVQLKSPNSGEWSDIGGPGKMADWMTWGPGYVFANLNGKQLAAGQNQSSIFVNTLLKPVYEYSAININHPLFGSNAHKWQNVEKSERYTNDTDPIYRFWGRNGSANSGVHGCRRYGGGFLTIHHNYNTYEAYARPNAGKNNTYWCARGLKISNDNGQTGYYYIECSYGWVNGTNFGTTWGQQKESTWWSPKIFIVTVPIIYMSRPTDQAPITGNSVNE